VKAVEKEPAAVPAGQVCPRCAAHVRPDWNFCPTCSLPSRPEEEVLSSQIRVLRSAAGAGVPAPPSPLVHWIVGGTAAALVLGTLTIGVVLFVPRAAPLLPLDPVDPGIAEPVPVSVEQPGLAYVFQEVPGGAFLSGPPSEDRNWTDTVDVPPFEISRYETTNAQWMEYLKDRRTQLRKTGMFRDAVPSYWWRNGPGAPAPVDEEPHIPENEGASFPVRGISFDQAVEFCRWLDSTGRIRGARLPREEEWEKAARGTDGRTYPWGPEFRIRDRVAGGQIELPGAWITNLLPREVQRTDYDRSPYGCLHMGGNVSEWTDLWGGSSPDAPGPWDRYRVVRGASFQQDPKDGADSARTWAGFTDREKGIGADDVGFRIARDLPAAAGSPAGSGPGGK